MSRLRTGDDENGSVIASLKLYGPGVALCAAVSAVATLVEKIEVFFAGQSYLEALVIAILLGVLVRAFWAPGPAWRRGIGFSRQDRCSRSRSCCSAPRSAPRRSGRSGRSCCSASHHRGRRDRDELRDLPRARPAARMSHPDRVRQLDLRQLGDRGGRADHRRDSRTKSPPRSRSRRCSASSWCWPCRCWSRSSTCRSRNTACSPA